MTFGEVLSHFKKTETPESIVPLVENDALRNAVVAWRSVVISYSDNEECTEVKEAEQWKWMWTKVRFDQHEFGIVAGAKPQDVSNLICRLTGFRLIYPDGTINTFAAKFLQAIIMSKLPKPQRQPKEPESSKAPGR
jgi:hypothetical protein